MLWLLTRTWRVRWVRAGEAHRPRILCFWHGRQLPLLSYERRRGAVVMVSLSRDGALQSVILGLLGLRVVRGSSSRGGATGLLAFTRGMRSSAEGVFALDGPRGPARHAKPGAALAAKLSGASLVPLGAAAFPARAVQARWEEFLVPLPFARVVVVEGDSLDPASCDDGMQVLEAAVDAAERSAATLLRRWRGVTSTSGSG